jgi:uncharacterized protein YndB with AHSA1/START domain
MIDGTLETIDGRAALRFERRLAHSAERVWRAVTDPAELACWFVAPVPWVPRLGETFEGGGQRGEITALEEPILLAWTWGAERYQFDLRVDGEGCLLTFTHVFDERFGPGAQHAAGWETYLARLDAHLAGRQLTEIEAHAPIAELHERYAARFGEDPAQGRRSIAGMAFRDLTLSGGEERPCLRLERRYRHPVQRVWRAITDPGELEQWFPSNAPMEVVERSEPRLLVGVWYGDELRFELRPDDDGCVLVFTHTFADRDTSARTAAGWDRCFARFDALLADAVMSEAASLELWPDVHERYAETFGVDPGLGRRAYAAHPPT